MPNKAPSSCPERRILIVSGNTGGGGAERFMGLSARREILSRHSSETIWPLWDAVLAPESMLREAGGASS